MALIAVPLADTTRIVTSPADVTVLGTLLARVLASPPAPLLADVQLTAGGAGAIVTCALVFAGASSAELTPVAPASTVRILPVVAPDAQGLAVGVQRAVATLLADGFVWIAKICDAIGGAGVVCVALVVASSSPRPVPSTTDQLVKVNALDTTADFLFPKLAAGPGISLSVLNPGGYEQVQISETGASGNVLMYSFTSGVLPLAPVIAGQVLSRAIIWVQLAFDDLAATLVLGTVATPDLVLQAGDSQAFAAGQYETLGMTQFPGADTLQLTVSPGASTQGGGLVLWEFAEG